MSLEESDRIAAEGATAPRVALADIEANIAAEYYINAGNAVRDAQHTREDLDGVLNAPGSLSVLTLCIVVLRNGYTLIGKSAPADERNFDEAKGRHFAREDAIRQAWPLMGYALRERLANGN